MHAYLNLKFCSVSIRRGRARNEKVCFLMIKEKFIQSEFKNQIILRKIKLFPYMV